MTNQELDLKFQEICKEENFFDFITLALAFEKDYKTSNFYKQTKMPILQILKEYKMWDAIQLNKVRQRLQKLLDSIDTTHLMDLIDKMGQMFESENSETMSLMSEFKTIIESKE